jgi:hypothetical protein
MTTQEQYIQRLKELVIATFGRNITTSEDCIALSNAIVENVGISVDVESLEQLFLGDNSHLAPRPVMLSSLARYVGFTGWSDFCTARDVTPAENRIKLPVVRRWGVIGATAAAIVVLIISIVAMVSGGDDVQGDILSVDSRFRNLESEWVSRTIERCNTMRAYHNPNDPERYNNRVDSFIQKYRASLEKSVKSDVQNYALRHKITVDNATIDETAEIIIEKCIGLCEDLKIE